MKTYQCTNCRKTFNNLEKAIRHIEDENYKLNDIYTKKDFDSNKIALLKR